MFTGLHNKMLSAWAGVEGGTLFRNKFAKALETRFPKLHGYNNVLFVAPIWKWGLAIVPLWGVIQGFPSPEHIDKRQTLALTATGGLWTYYCMLVRPTAWMLVAVNVALLGANGTNLLRRRKYEKEQALLNAYP